MKIIHAQYLWVCAYTISWLSNAISRRTHAIYFRLFAIRRSLLSTRNSNAERSSPNDYLSFLFVTMRIANIYPFYLFISISWKCIEIRNSKYLTKRMTIIMLSNNIIYCCLVRFGMDGTDWLNS